MIVGTAGHIDHGKTTLVRALTGVDTDRLAEEKARGISIELGYAYLAPAGDAPTDAVLGFVDVPGHERFVHTMVAGASGIDVALLVVAADDGVMPQTREHVAILDLLGARAGAVAMTKVDRVDAARVDAVRADVAALLAHTALAGAPSFALDARDPHDPGLAALREHLLQVARAHTARDADGFFRLAVDRVFSLAGHGTVVTGTVHSGRVARGDGVVVLPAGHRARVRGIHAQNREEPAGRAGQRCALNLAGVERDAIARGDWIADARAMQASSRLDVRVRHLADGAPLPDWTPLHVHIGTLHRLAHGLPLEAPVAGSQRMQLVFDEPVCAAAGDRFVLRDAQARATICGGVVLDPCAPARRRRSAARLATLAALEAFLAGHGLEAVLRDAPLGLVVGDFERRIGRPVRADELPVGVHRLGAGADALLLADARWHALRERVIEALATQHAAAPDEPGVDPARLRRIAMPEAGEGAGRALVEALVRDGVLARRGPWLHLPSHRVELSDDERALAARIEPLLLEAGADPPWVRDLATCLHVHEEDVRRCLRKSAVDGRVHQVVRDLFYADACLRSLACVLRTLVERDGSVGAGAFRDAVGLGRKRAIQVLEFFDRVGYTRRVRDARVLRAGSGWGDDGSA